MTASRVFVLDTNVLMQDPGALFRFAEHDIYIPMVVLEELDAAKKGVSELARNVREVSRRLDDLVHGLDHSAIEHGIALPSISDDVPGGKLFFQTAPVPDYAPSSLPGTVPDNSILNCAIALSKERPDATVVLVSKDINLRIKASLLGIRAEDYHHEVVVEDVDLLYSGTQAYSPGFWTEKAEIVDSWQREGVTSYKLEGNEALAWHANQCLYDENDTNFDAIVREIDEASATIELTRDYRDGAASVWGVHARNREQNFALNLLMNPAVDFVTLLGTAGTGKTLLALAAGLAQTLDDRRYREIVMTRVTVPVGEDIGFLPGTEEEKMTPWMGALMDNLEVLSVPSAGDDWGGDWGRSATNDLMQNRIKVRSLNFMRGRTFLNRYLILDEAQNLTRKQMKTLITRAGPGTKIVCLGNIAQIDTPYLSETTSGLTYVVERFKPWAHSGHITLRRGERSRLADFAAEQL